MGDEPKIVRRDTEGRHPQAAGFDQREPTEAAALLADAQREASAVVSASAAELAQASRLMADALTTGGRLVYAGAGSSGLLAMADALELPGTFGIPREQVAIVLAGGAHSLSDLAGGFEDDHGAARRDIDRLDLSAADCVLVVSASGSTPYALQVAESAVARHAPVIALANNTDAPLFDHAKVAILLDTPPEMVAGSTRMGAGTAQKIALNVLSTLTATRLGCVHDGYMVNLRADNAKLHGRATRIVAAITDMQADEAGKWLDKAGGSVKPAVLMAMGVPDRADADQLLARHGHNLRSALQQLRVSEGQSNRPKGR